MSFFNAILAARGSREQLREGFFRVWDKIQIVDCSPESASNAELDAWIAPRSKNPGSRSIVEFWQDDEWAVLWTDSMAYLSDEARLSQLSSELGSVAVGLTQGTSGTAIFQLHEHGTLEREISTEGGQHTEKGNPIPAEAGIDIANRFYVEEIERLWIALGMSSFWRWDRKAPAIALLVLDTEDYGLPAIRPKPKRPWWRFW